MSNTSDSANSLTAASLSWEARTSGKVAFWLKPRRSSTDTLERVSLRRSSPSGPSKISIPTGSISELSMPERTNRMFLTGGSERIISPALYVAISVRALSMPDLRRSIANRYTVPLTTRWSRLASESSNRVKLFKIILLSISTLPTLSL